MLNFIKIDREVFFLAHPLLTRWQAHVCGGCRLSSLAEQTLWAGAELHLLVATWKCSSNYQVLPPSWQSGHKHKLAAACLFFVAHSILSYAGRAQHETCAAMFPSVFSFSYFFFSLSLLACHFAGECCLARWAYAQYFWGQMSQALRPHCQQTWGIIRVNKLKAT